MQSAKKSTKILSALSMAAAATLAAKSAHGATLSLYYGNDPNYTNSNNSIMVSTGYSAAAGTKNTTGGTEYFSGQTQIPVTGGIQTITVPVGDYLSLAIDAVLTGNVNADAGKNTGTGTKSTAHNIQPSYLGLSTMSVAVTSSDTNAAKLTPISTSTPVSTAGNGGTTYFSTAVINTLSTGSKVGTNGSLAYNVVPNWVSLTTGGDVEPNEPGFDSGTHASGNVFINSAPFGGITPGTTGGTSESASNTITGINQLEQFASSTNTASYAGATDFLDSLVYQGLSAGLVTLAPVANTSAISYWSLATAGTSTSLSQYKTTSFSAADTINGLPLLVIDVIKTVTLGNSHAIVALADTAGDNANYPGGVTGTFSPATSPTLTVSGHTGSYTTAQVTAINGGAGDATGNVPVTTWNPITDAEIYGVDVKVGGVQATVAQLNVLLAAIAGDGVAPASGVTASLTDPTNGALSSLDGGNVYNLFLTFAGGPSAADDLGLDLSASNDSNLTGYTFNAIAVVPEPMSLSLLALGGVGLMARRNRRKA